MNLDVYLQKAIISLMIKDSDFLQKTILFIDPFIFSDPYLSLLSKLIINHVKIYKEHPSLDFLKFLIEKECSKEKDRILLCLENILEVEANKSYILNQLNLFVRRKNVQNAIEEANELLQKNKFEEIESVLLTALRKGSAEVNWGRDYFKFNLQDFYDRRQARKEGLKLNIGRLDNLVSDGEGIVPGSLVVFVGDEKGTKSFALSHVAIEGALQGYNALYVTCELHAWQVEERIDQNVTGQTRKYLSGSSIKQCREALQIYGGGIRVIEYPQNTCTISDLKRLLDGLDQFENFSTQLLLVDYLDILLANKEYTEERHKRNSLSSGLKTIASERNIIVGSATQTIKAAVGKRRKTKTDTSEDKRTVANADLLIGIGQTEKEKERSIQWISVVANREGPEGKMFPIRQDIERGYFFLEEVGLNEEEDY